MKRTLAALAFVGLVSAPAYAALTVGATAPDFTATASIGGTQFEFSLAEARAKGPVVVYFYPAAFTPGCTIEANAFAEATDELAQYNATVIGVSGDDIETLDRFSVSECRSKFAVAADPETRVMDMYDVENPEREGRAQRISFVVAPDGSIIYSHEDRDPIAHVNGAKEAVISWAASH
nr:MAG: peroxiredoxin [Hyphomicrobiales bacterium]